MIIKAKYPAFYRPYMQDVYQGYGGLSGGQNTSVVDSTITENSIIESSYSFEGRVLRDGGTVVDYCGQLRYLLGEDLTGAQQVSQVDSQIVETDLVNSSYYFEYRVLQDGGVVEYHNTRLMYLLGENLTGGQNAC